MPKLGSTYPSKFSDADNLELKEYICFHWTLLWPGGDKCLYITRLLTLRTRFQISLVSSSGGRFIKLFSLVDCSEF